jgi:hypothetical protein
MMRGDSPLLLFKPTFSGLSAAYPQSTTTKTVPFSTPSSGRRAGMQSAQVPMDCRCMQVRYMHWGV